MTTAFTPNVPEHAGLSPLASRVCDTNKLPWEAIRYPGVQVKTLVVDKASGLLTVLLRMEAGARLPDHEHALIEQTLVLEGSLIDTEGPEKGLTVGPGQFVFRPAGSRHAVESPDGCLVVAIFQSPNKFYEGGGDAVDMMGNDWGSAWGHTLARP